MANRRLTIRNIKEILRIKFEAGRSIRRINYSAGTSVGSIQKLLEEATQVQLSWSLPEEIVSSSLNSCALSAFWGQVPRLIAAMDAP